MFSFHYYWREYRERENDRSSLKPASPRIPFAVSLLSRLFKHS